jgi:hypothetical protein
MGTVYPLQSELRPGQGTPQRARSYLVPSNRQVHCPAASRVTFSGREMAILRSLHKDGADPSLGCSKSPTFASPTDLQSVAMLICCGTFAVELLNKGGARSTGCLCCLGKQREVSEEYYAPFVKEGQRQLEIYARTAWEDSVMDASDTQGRTPSVTKPASAQVN